MIKSFKITNHLDESIFIDIRKPEDTGFLITSVEGLGPVRGVISQAENAMMDGSIISTSRLEPRNIVFNILFMNHTHDKLSVEDIRQKSYIYFPIKKEIEIVVENDHGEYKIKGIVESNEIPIFTKEEGAQVSIICADPFFEKSEIISQYISRVVPIFEFPFSCEAIFDEPLPPEEHQEDVGMRKIIDEDGNVYWEYRGPYSAISDDYNDQVLGFAGRFSDKDVTVNKIPYIEETNPDGSKTIRIGGVE